MAEFKVYSDLDPQGSQPQAITNLTNGIQKGQEFQTQVSMITDDETTKIPDVIVHFPDKDGQRDVVIDSKVSLTAWDEYVNSDDENIKEDALKRHKKSIKDHIDSLTKKNYQRN